MDYRIEHFSLAINGLSHTPDVQATTAQQSKLEENTTANIGNFEITIKKAYPKKDMFYFTMTAQFKGSSNQFGTMMFPEIAIGSNAGKAMTVSLSPRKLELIKSGKRIKMSGDFESKDKSFTVDWGKTFKNYTLRPIQVAPIGMHKIGSSIVKPVTPINNNNNNNNNVSTCGAVRGNSQGQTKINFYSAERKCFKVYVNGALVSNDYGTNVTFNCNSGKKTLEFQFQDGQVLKDEIFISRDWLEAAFQLKPNGNSYALNLNLGSVIKDEPAPIVVDNGGNGGNGGNNTSNGGINTRTTTTNDNSGGNESSQDETYKGKTKCHPENVTNGQFIDMKQQINSESSEGNKLTIAEDVVRGRCMTAAQVSDICRIFSTDDKKIEFAKYAFRYTYDIDNYYVVVNTLSSDTKKKELREYTRNN